MTCYADHYDEDDPPTVLPPGSYFFDPNGYPLVGRPSIPKPPRDDFSIERWKLFHDKDHAPDFTLGLVHICETCHKFCPVVFVEAPTHMVCLNCETRTPLAMVAHVRLAYPSIHPVTPGMPIEATEESITKLLQTPAKAHLGMALLWDSWRQVHMDCVPGDLAICSDFLYAEYYQDLMEEGVNPQEYLYEWWFSDRYKRYLTYSCLPSCRSMDPVVHTATLREGSYLYGPVGLVNLPLEAGSDYWVFDCAQWPNDTIFRFSNPHGEDHPLAAEVRIA